MSFNQSTAMPSRDIVWLQSKAESVALGVLAKKIAGRLVENMHTDHLDWPLPAHRRGTLRGMDAA
ncbi:hypothetical protein [Xanthomonas hortorum]|uniref:hypothetical protein n=1 Tax=Xanthomonas hortorum TaxID=56454 RepID=UPI0017B46D41|nr:hypothetical protein [Xanthomonas hortorum]MCE4361451.1 hypothetical protein [Xanthomonas hortorum]NMI51278.1 hypothetical protein [Xanthomonas hortorum pv. taraxaci]